MEKSYLKKLNVRILILSRSRYNSITAHKILPEYIEILVPESQKSLYEKSVNNPIITVPDNIKGLGSLRNWVLDHFSEKCIIMIDDDVKGCYSLMGSLSKRMSKDEIIEILISTYITANDSGCKVFGFSQTDIRKYNACDPFKLNTWIGGVIGIIGRDYRFRDDKFKVDIDFCLQNLLIHRIVWCDARYLFDQERDNNVGGNSDFRTEEEYFKSLDSLLKKWGKYIKISDTKSQFKVRLKVKRRQRIKW